jgi:hypothetical protein
MAKFLLFETDYTVKLKKGKIKDGKVTIDKKEFIVDKAKPLQMMKAFGSQPLYLIKWNSLTPIYPNVKEEKKTLLDPSTNEQHQFVKKDIEFLNEPPDFKESKTLPEMLASTQDMRFLKGMKKYAGGGMGLDLGDKMPLILLFIILFAFGFLMTYGYQVGWFA